MFDRIRAFLEHKPARFIIACGWVTIILLGMADRATGHEFDFGIFYLLPRKIYPFIVRQLPSASALLLSMRFPNLQCK